MKKNRTEELLKEKLREKGLKVTNQRILILSVLEQNKGRHLTAEDIYELVTQEHPEIGLATVYRTIQLLWDMQLIDKINLDEGCVRYEIGHLLDGGSKHNHHHAELAIKSFLSMMTFWKKRNVTLNVRLDFMFLIMK